VHFQDQASYNVLAGNFIGTDRTGMSELGNWTGIGWYGGVHDNQIGTNGTDLDSAGERNLISGNLNALGPDGFDGQPASTHNLIAGNYIGTDANGNPGAADSHGRTLLGNGKYLDYVYSVVDNSKTYINGYVGGGIDVDIESAGDTIGGTDPALANVIAYNNAPGVAIQQSYGIQPAPSGITIRGNSIHDNLGLGIDLGGYYNYNVPNNDGDHPDGVTLNDSSGHTGPNNFQDFPVLTSVISSSTNTWITGTFSEAAEPNTTITLDFYANASKDASGYGQGQTWLGSSTVTTTATGNASFTVNLAVSNLAGEWITATATAPNAGTPGYGNTSEFCADVQAASLIVLNATANGALSLSSTATINVPGSVVVDSSSKTALTESGSASIKAASIDVVGGVSTSGTATLSPAPTTGVAVVPDPLASLAAPSTTGLTNYGAVNYSSGTHTLNPGTYTSIAASGTATSVTLNPGIYILEGGGLSISGTAVVSGNGVMLYNTSSKYPGSGGSYGSIALSGGTLNLTAATTGSYAGVVIFQDRSNTKSLKLSGSALVEGTGNIVYVPDALVSLSNSANLQGALVVGTLSMSGNSNPSSGSPARQLAGLAGPISLTAALDLGATWDATAAQTARLLPGAEALSAAGAWPDAGQGAFAQLTFVEAVPSGARQHPQPAWLGLAGASPVAQTDAVDYLFANIGS
jgi:hypothetical protein